MPSLKPEGGTPRERALWGDLIAMGMVFPIAICLGYFIGRYVGGYFGHAYAGGLWGLAWGIATGFYELYKVTARMARVKPAPEPAEPTEPTEPTEGPVRDDEERREP